MTNFDDAEPAAAPAEPARDADTGILVDRYGRYRIPMPPDLNGIGDDGAPAGGVPKSWTRATTMASTMEYQGNLTDWKLRMAVKGVGLRPDLALKARGSGDDKDALNDVVTQALTVAGATAGSNAGTGMHGVSAEIDRIVATTAGAERAEAIQILVSTLPGEYARDVQAYYRLITDDRCPVVSAADEFDELVVAHPDLMVAGRFDKLRLVNGKLVIVDLKTHKGEPGKYGQLPIAMQLAIYAHAPFIYDPAAQRWFRMPAQVSKREAYVIWLPSGQGRAKLIKIDILTGWRWVEFAMKTRESRNVRGLYFPVTEVSADEGPSSPVAQPAAPSTPAGELAATEMTAQHIAELRAKLTEPRAMVPATFVDKPRSKRRCGKCGTPGHNARNCPADAGGSLPNEYPDVTPVPGQSESDAVAHAAASAVEATGPQGPAPLPPPANITEMLQRAEACVCANPDGWSTVDGRPDITVCGRCGRPSEAILRRVLGERSGMMSLSTAPSFPSPDMAVPARPQPPEGTPPGSPEALWPWHARITRAATQDDLRQIHADAVAAGVWEERYLFPHAQDRYLAIKGLTA